MLRLAAGRCCGFGQQRYLSAKMQAQHKSSGARRLLSEVPIRRDVVTIEERALLRAARKQKAARFLQESGDGAGSATGAAGAASSSSGSSSVLNIPSAYHRYVWFVGLSVPTLLVYWGYNDENSPPARFSGAIGLTGLLSRFADPFLKPTSSKLLPDWADVPNVPPDIPCPHTLVLDLENTLISSKWDRKLGWRHAKRPGVDKFLQELSQYYEIVLYTPSDQGMIEPVVASLDKNMCIMHRLYRADTLYTNGIHVKDLNALNRPLGRMVVLDDNPDEVRFNRENLIRVKPYVDPTDREDTTLKRIMPLLIEFAREGYNDIPQILAQYEGMDADQIADEYENRIVEYTAERRNMKQRGLGRFSPNMRQSMPEPELPPTEYISDAIPGQLTAKDLVGAAPTTSSLAGDGGAGIMGWLNRRRAEKEEQTMRKHEKWQEVMMKKQREKKEQLEQQLQQQQQV